MGSWGLGGGVTVDMELRAQLCPVLSIVGKSVRLGVIIGGLPSPVISGREPPHGAENMSPCRDARGP